MNNDDFMDQRPIDPLGNQIPRKTTADFPQLAFMLGTPYTPAVKDVISEMTTYSTVFGPDEPQVKTRFLQIETDSENHITGFSAFG